MTFNSDLILSTFFDIDPSIRALLFASFAYVLSKLIFFTLSALSSKTNNSIDDYFIQHANLPLSSSLILLSFYGAIYSIDHPFIDIVFSIIITIVILLWSLYLKKILRYTLVNISRNHNKDSLIQLRTIPLFQNMGVLSITVLSVYLVFSAWHVDMTAWLASAGIIGIAIGFAAKDTLANLFSGVFILADAPYKIGDYIVLDTAERGMVTAIGIRSTRILTRDDVEITIPNSVMGNTKIMNQSGGRHVKFRLRIKIGVAYGSDLDLVKSILLEISKNEPLICALPEPRLRLRNFGDSSVNFELLCWVDNPEFKGRATDIINTKVYKLFNEHQIEIPYPKRDVYLK